MSEFTNGGDGYYSLTMKCRMCNTIRHRNSSWIYKRSERGKYVYFCGYNCMRQYDKMSEAIEEIKNDKTGH